MNVIERTSSLYGLNISSIASVPAMAVAKQRGVWSEKLTASRNDSIRTTRSRQARSPSVMSTTAFGNIATLIQVANSPLRGVALRAEQ